MPTRFYDQGSRPRVFINWQSFETWGISPRWKSPFTDAVMNAYTRWMQVAGVDLRFQFWNYTTSTTANRGELLIQMNETFTGTTRLASTFGTYGQLTIVFHRKNGTDLTPWNFVPYNAVAGEFDMQGILTHEFGHCHGLDHIDSETATMNSSYGYANTRLGPLRADIASLRGLYSSFTNNRLRQLQAASGASAWTAASNNITTSGSTEARTNISPGAVEVPPGGLYLIGWSEPSSAPTWLRGDGGTFMFGDWFVYGGERSLHGPAYAADDAGRLLWAWVDNDGVGTVKVVSSTDQGHSWSWAAAVPSGAKTGGTPGLCWTRVGGQSTWILVWSHFDVADQAETGHLRTSLSGDGGGSWSPPVTIESLYKALSGVSAAATADNRVLLAFAFAPHSIFGINAVVTSKCAVRGGNLEVNQRILPGEATRVQPALTYDADADRFVMAWRNQDFNTTLSVRTMATSASTWSAATWTALRSNVAPALAYSRRRRQAVLWYASED